MLDRITPVILTRNEAPNIARTLGRLTWARDIVVVDSCSDDETERLARALPQVRFVTRAFDTHAQQWNFAVHETGISTEWVLALDADYLLTEDLVAEIASLDPDRVTSGYRAGFRYVVDGLPLRGSAYPPVTVLFRRRAARYVQDGHTQRVLVDGAVRPLRSAVLHDDRKPLDRWLMAQRRYAALEAENIATKPWRELSWSGRLRRLRVVSPLLMPVYCLFWKGAVLDGRRGLHYAVQRTLAELLVSLHLLDGRKQPAAGALPSRAEAVQPR